MMRAPSPFCARARKNRAPRCFFARARKNAVLGRWLSLSLLGLLACAHTGQVESRLVELRALTQRARDQGAYRCAPEELARSEAHLEFAQRELDQGDPVRAREHLVLVSANAKAALRLSSEAGCTAASPSAPEARLDLGLRGALTKNTAQLTERRGSTKEHAAI
jgi:hypothetical protein